MEKILNLEDSNNYIIKLIQSNKPFLIARPGIPMDFVYYYMITNQVPGGFKYIKNYMENGPGTGIYGNNIKDFEIWFEKYTKPIKECDAIGTWKNTMHKEQNYFINTYNLVPIYSRSLEPFYCCVENIKPWTHYLFGKKVLIIHPFIKSMKKQLNNNFQIFKDKEKKIFLDGQQFIFYKAYQTSAGNHLHSSWNKTYKIMCKKIKKLDFDIALLGCGCYGHPLCDFIKNSLNKSAIYIGGGLQLLFGIMGRRWEKREDWKKIIKENDTKFIKPSEDEIIKNKSRVEGGCYW